MLAESETGADGMSGPPKHVQAAILTEEIEELRCKQARQNVRCAYCHIVHFRLFLIGLQNHDVIAAHCYSN